MQALLEILYKNNLSKSYKEPVRYTSVALCAVGTSIILHNLRPLRDSVCLLYKTFSLSLHISEEPLITLLLCLLLSYYHVLNTLLLCLLLSYYHVLNTLLPCLLLLCLMSSITLLPYLLLLCLHQGMQNHKKRVDKLIIPRSHTPQNN